MEADEVSFLEGKIILIEGQKMLIYRKIAEQFEMSFKGYFFGWGVGRTTKMNAFMCLFKDLENKHVVTIFDWD